MRGLGDEEPILNYFNGGLGGNGSGPGPADCIVFSSNSLALISESQGGTGNLDNNPSGGPVAFFLSGAADTMNVAAGFTTGFSFYYTSTEDDSITEWSGLNGTGTELADIALNANATPGLGLPGRRRRRPLRVGSSRRHVLRHGEVGKLWRFRGPDRLR
jgi:hypothetical protein